MIIELHNFGPIEKFSFDTKKRMHVIFGENNVGKSYAIAAVYLILKNWRYRLNSEFEFSQNSFNKLKFSEKLSVGLVVNEDIEHLSKVFLSGFLQKLSSSLNNSFSSVAELMNKNSRKSFSIVVKTDLYSLEIVQKNDKLEIKKITFSEDFKIVESIEKHFAVSSTNYDGNVLFDYLPHEIASIAEYFNFTIPDIFKIETHNTYFEIGDLFFLPSSRSGIYNGMSAWSEILALITQFRHQLPNDSLKIPSVSEPISDYFLNLTSINRKGYDTPFSEVAKKIEDTIIKGKINFDKSNKKLYYEPQHLDLSLELSQASSMISEIAPIIAHLKFLFSSEKGSSNKNSFLFIEEPEAHLHPKVQVALMQLFAELAEAGLHIVMTSHSNYLFNKLSNMVLAKEVSPETISVCLMKMGEKGSFIDENAMSIDDDGIDDDNFADTAEALYTERLKLYEQ